MVKVKEVMRRFVVTVEPNVTVSEAAKVMQNNKIGSVIVSDGTKMQNIVTANDIVFLVAEGLNPKKERVGDLHKDQKMITVSPEDDVIKVSKMMVKAGIKRVPVIHEGKLAGILSDKEIMLTTPELLEVMSERLKARIAAVASPDQEISGLCERCEVWSDELHNVSGKWMCTDCRNLEPSD